MSKPETTETCGCPPGYERECVFVATGTCPRRVMPSVQLRIIAAQRKDEVRRLQSIIVATVEEVQRIEAQAAQLESEGR